MISSTPVVGQRRYNDESVKPAAAAAAEGRSTHQVNLHLAAGELPLALTTHVRLTVCRALGGELDGVLQFFRLGRERAGLRRLRGVLGKVLVLLGNTRT